MSAFTDEELIDYVLGAPGARVEDIERQAAVDEELAAQIAIMLGMCGRDVPGPIRDEEGIRRQSRWKQTLQSLKRFFRKNLVAACLAVGLLSVAGGAWAVWSITHRPLLEDHFQRRSFDSTRWSAPRPRVRPEQGFIRLINRGYLVTQQEFEGPIEIRFRWKWVDLAENPPYSEDLTVALRTTGEPKPNRPYEIADGVCVRFITYDGTVRLGPTPPVPSPDDPPESRRITPRGSVPVPSDSWHDVRITDDGLTIAVYITGPELPPENATAPIIKVDWPHPTKGHKIAFYNREMLEWAAHESHITDIVISRHLP